MFPCALNPHARETLSDQLYGALLAAMASGALPTGARLPSRRALSRDLSVSPSTVEAAYARLIEEGRCEARPRSGIYVLPGAAGRAGKPEGPPPVRYDFGTGSVDAERFPFSTWARLMREVLSERSPSLLAAGDPRGGDGLRRALSALLRESRGIEADPETLIVGAGTDMLLCDLLARLGRELLFAVEDPGYPRVRRALSAGGARIIPLPLSGGAMDLRALYASGAGAVYVTPSHQFPTGREMDAAERAALLSWSRETGGVILEDDYDSEFRFSGEALPAMRSQDARVVYLNTFSRTLAPGLRVGYMALPPALVPRYLEMRHACSVPAFLQETLAKFISGGHLTRHVARMRTAYGSRLSALREGAAACALGTLHPCPAGLFALLTAAGPLAPEQLVPRARAFGVRLARVADFRVMEAPGGDRTVLLGFAGMDETDILAGLRALAAAWETA